MLFDDPARYYGHEDGRHWDQGDVVLAPVAVFSPSEDAAEAVGAPPPIGDLRTQVIWLEAADEFARPRVAIEAGVVPAMVLTHGCTLDKEFNREVGRLRREPMPLRDAVRRAAAMPTLDRLVNVAPLVPLAEAGPSSAADLAGNRVMGFFPVCGAADLGIDEGAIDLLRQTTVDRGLLLARLAILSDEARASLRYSLARFWAWRAPRLTFELEEAIGRRIMDARIQGEGDLLLELELNDGSVLRLLQAASGDQPGPTRPMSP